MPITSFTVNSRPLSTFLPLKEERTLALNKNYLFDLSYLAGIDVIGDISGEFLQGQVSCDVREVTPLQIRQGASCDLKGRILSLFDIVDWNGLHLILPEDLLSKTLLSLSKTALLSRIRLEKSSAFQVLGFILNNPDDILPCKLPLPNQCFQVTQNDNVCCYQITPQSYIILARTESVKALSEPFIQHHQWRGSLLWHELQLKHHQLELYPESRGLFLPHRLDLHKTHRLSFNKGCYKGQEIIARTHYRAKRKHAMALFTIVTDEPLKSGMKVLQQDNHIDLGELIDYCPIGEDTYLMAASMILNPPSAALLEGHVKVVKFE